MGDVFKARQRGTDRIVAVKMVRADWAGRMQPDELRAAISQFHTEIKAAARLQHARIVHVFHMGEVGDQPFFVMEHVDGESLADRIQRDGPLSNREATETMAAVADAVHDVHQHGILHRDIKPQNILVESTSGEPKIADFGLATLQADDDASSHGKVDWDAVVETIPYMAPELFGGASGSTVLTEVYSLGATLYELLTGRPPFCGTSQEAIIREIEDCLPPAPCELNPDVSRRLEQICMRCLEKDPKLRYASAKDLAADLQNFLGTPKSSVHMATMSNFLFAVSFSILLINAGVYGLLQGPFSEPVVWGLVFSMYPPIFYFLSYIPRRPGRDNRQALTQLWTMWLGKMFAAICISISLRIVLGDARAAVLMSYPMFAGLSGMILFVMAPQYWSGFYANAIGFWIVGVLMLLNREWAPLEYGAVASIGIAVYGIYVRRVAREYG